MTAEIAVLNKTAVALATDSAVTISSGRFPAKIFETADKLFEISQNQPIAIMVYNGMQFLGVPLEAVIKSFRKENLTYHTVADAADAFLAHLYEYVDEAPDAELLRAVMAVIGPISDEITRDISGEVETETLRKLQTEPPPNSDEDFEAVANAAVERVLQLYESRVSNLGSAEFIPRPDKKAQKARYKKFIEQAVDASLSGFALRSRDRIVEICMSVMQSSYISNSKTGLVFAGFGETEMFPTLVSYEIDGLHDAKIRLAKTDECDIDRNGLRAYVRPFAQKDMVDRFLHGLDDRLRADITKFCEQTVGEISDGIFAKLDIENEAGKEALMRLAKEAEKAFIRNLNDVAFANFQQKSRREIEDMVEFMPKPELAKMAEALIDLTSIKRKVSEGPETVGGPVDVAVISKGEGFVWVKRKHYFPADLNQRYFDRLSEQN